MRIRRTDLGFSLANAEAAVAAFVDRLLAEDHPAEQARHRLYSAGLDPQVIYSLKKKGQRELGAARLVTALVACQELEVVIEGGHAESSAPRRWVVRAYSEASPSRDSSPELNSGGPLQLSLSSSIQSGDSVEIEMRDVHVTRKEPHKADVRIDFVLRSRRAG